MPPLSCAVQGWLPWTHGFRLYCMRWCFAAVCHRRKRNDCLPNCLRVFLFCQCTGHLPGLPQSVLQRLLGPSCQSMQSHCDCCDDHYDRSTKCQQQRQSNSFQQRYDHQSAWLCFAVVSGPLRAGVSLGHILAHDWQCHGVSTVSCSLCVVWLRGSHCVGLSSHQGEH